MKNRFLKGFAVTAVLAFATGLAVTPAHAANEVVVWADETRGPNLAKVIAAKGDWVAGYTIKIVSFSSFDAGISINLKGGEKAAV